MAYHHKLRNSRILRALLIAAGVALFLTGCESSPSYDTLMLL